LLGNLKKIIERLEKNPRSGKFLFVNRLVSGEEREQVLRGEKKFIKFIKIIV